MIRDVFYFNKKPNVHPREKHADNLAHARTQSTTEHFWIINEFCEYRNFDWDWDFEFLHDEDVWAEEHNNVWPSLHQKDSGTWLCSTEFSDVIIYRADVEPIARKNEISEHWNIIQEIDKAKFDFSWHPDVGPAFIYVWGNKWHPVELEPVIEYHVNGATERKYMSDVVEVLPQTDRWVENQSVDKTKFDFTWRPDPREPAFIYVWGNKFNPVELEAALEYHCPGATEVKYMTEVVEILPDMKRWVEILPVDHSSGFDFTWRPDPREPAYIYVWGNKFNPVELEAALEYHCRGATEVKYMTEVVEILPDMKRWVEILPINKSRFDFTWRPDPREPAYIYVWGNKFNPVELESALEYHCPGATEVKYMTEVVEILPDEKRWVENQSVDKTKFDFTWRPDPREPAYIYVWGNKFNPVEIDPVLEYHCRGATEVKYMTEVVEILPDEKRWKEILPVDHAAFDFSWRPDPREPAYIYVWGNKFNPVQLEPALEYHCRGATEVKYMTEVVEILPDMKRWVEILPVDHAAFDFSWRPDPREPAYIYVWGNKFNPVELESTLEYHCPGATEVKYMTEVVEILPDEKRWVEILPINKSRFDFTWRPDPREPAYIYVWGNQWNSAVIEPTVEYHMPGSIDRKYVDDSIAIVSPYAAGWETLIEVDIFDYSWRPDPTSPPYVYVFGNTQYPGTVMPTVKLNISGVSQEKFIDEITAKLAQKPDLFENIELNSDFDYSWRPDPTSPPYVYQFGTLLDENDGPRYVVPGNTGVIVNLERPTYVAESIPKYYITTTLEDLAAEHTDELFWALNPEIDYTTFDFTWRPSIEKAKYVQAFGSRESISTQTYFVNGAMWYSGFRDINYLEEVVELTDDYLFNLFKKVDMFYVDRGNAESQQRFAALMIRFPSIQKTRYLNSWVDTINRCINRVTTNLCWVLNSELDYTNFEFDFYPSPWQMNMVQVFGTQWSHWGTTFMVNKNTFAEDTKYVKIIEHLSNLNFVKRKVASATNCLYDAVVVDHGNEATTEIVLAIQSKIPTKSVSTIKYTDSYLNTFKELLKILPEKKEHYIWVCSSICDYSAFDFSYICDPFAKEQLHVFPSDKQKFGDTFLVNVNKLRLLVTDMTSLEDYKKINYNQHQRVKRLLAPQIITTDDTHVNSAKADFKFPYAVLTTYDNVGLSVVDAEPMSLWAPEHKNIIITSVGGTRIIVPAEAKNYITRELYDYPHIISTPRLAKSSPLDIVFLSNGEAGADSNYEHLLKLTKGLPNKVVRVDGIDGRVAAYHAAATASSSPWMFTVFAKLKVNHKFDWNWQPDRLQIAKHYIFNATNPVNGLEYGHQAMIAYNKNIVLSNLGKGLDFTLDDEHEVVELNSGTAHFNTDAWSTWRTAFREAIKLRASDSEESADRLNTWATKAIGDFAEYSLLGTKHAVEYYDEVSGDMDMLRLSYDWPWLSARFASLIK